MRIVLKDGIKGFTQNGLNGKIHLVPGVPREVPSDIAMQLIGQGIAKREDVPWIQNNKTVVFDTDSPRPVGPVVEKKPGKKG